jgi:hypothetical protein
MWIPAKGESLPAGSAHVGEPILLSEIDAITSALELPDVTHNTRVTSITVKDWGGEVLAIWTRVGSSRMTH